MELRGYQRTLVNDIACGWTKGRNVLAVLPTGGGKTVVFSHMIHAMKGRPSVAIAHRQELVSQIALALARNNVQHRIIGPKSLIKFVINNQHNELGTTLYNPTASCAVAGVDTLIKREMDSWRQQVGLWVIDEGHHVTKGNKWGTAVNMFPNAYGLGVTATPLRADGKGLGRHSDGVFDTLVEGPGMRTLVEDGWLSDYRIFAPPSDIDLQDVTISANGDFSPVKLKRAVRSSHVIGDVVEHYKRIAHGKLGITFASDVETAGDIAAEFRKAGVPAEMVSAKTPDNLRTEIVRKLRARELMQLVNVDLFGEGFDLPAIEVVSMARPTQSYGLYCQQFGRSLRIMGNNPDKVAIIIDHVGNVVRHGLPDREMEWSLDGRERRPKRKDDDIPLRYCPSCTQPYERVLVHCPYCGHKPVPAVRSRPEFVDGDLYELDPLVLEEMRGKVREKDDIQSVINRMRRAHAPDMVIKGYRNRALKRIEMQHALRESISAWASHYRVKGVSDSEAYRRFYHLFGTDVLTAQTLNRSDALELADRINDRLGAI